MTGKTDQQQEASLDSGDLDMVDDRLEDEGKDDAELWDELDQAETGAADDSHDDLPSGKPDGDDQDGDDWAASGDGDDSGKTPGSADGDDDSDDASARNRQSGEQSAPDTADDAQLWAEATPEQRAAYEAAQTKLQKLEQAERSNRGRLSALQRQINELTQRQSPAAPKGAAKEQGADDGKNDDGFLASSDWTGFQEEYPEVAGPLGKLIGKMQEQITRQDKELSAIGNDRRQSALEEQATLLAGEHPDWQDIGGSSEFVDWVFTQPRHIQEAAERNANEIVDAAEAADLIGRFKQTLPPQGGDNAQGTDTSRAENNGRGNGNNRLAGKRKRQLESASTARSRGPGAASGISEDGDEETIWRQFDEMERRQAGRA